MLHSIDQTDGVDRGYHQIVDMKFEKGRKGIDITIYNEKDKLKLIINFEELKHHKHYKIKNSVF